MTYTIEQLEKNDWIIFSARMGSHAYGTALPTSDVDIRGVFIQPYKDIFKYGYVEQISDEANDIVYYELKRFVELAMNNNPNILELLFTPEDCIIKITEEWKMLRDINEQFLTTICRLSFAGYAIGQIKKARGYNKKMNWEESEMKRKTVLDFCYILDEGGSRPLKEWLEEEPKFKQEDFSLANINHAHNLYAMYNYPGGIVSDENIANDVQLRSIPKGYSVIRYLTFNKDAYSNHCRKFKEYQTWLKERNEDRFKLNKEHGKNYDSKNMLHVYRLLNTAIEIAKDKTINVRRSDEEIKILMKIRMGEYEYDDLLNNAEELIKKVDEEFENSDLPNKVNEELIRDVMLNIRNSFYFIL